MHTSYIYDINQHSWLIIKNELFVDSTKIFHLNITIFTNASLFNSAYATDGKMFL